MEDEIRAEKNKNITSSPEFCELPSERGPCHGWIIRYYFNARTNRCQKFIYSGCQGNENNFHVKLACEAICKNPAKKAENSLLSNYVGIVIILTSQMLHVLFRLKPTIYIWTLRTDSTDGTPNIGGFCVTVLQWLTL